MAVYVICGSNGTIIGGDSLSNLTKKSTNVSVNFVTIDFEDIYVALDDVVMSTIHMI